MQRAAAVPDAEVLCAGCGAPTESQGNLDGHSVRRCSDCGLYALTLIAARHDTARLDRTQFEGALRALRLANYGRILEQLERVVPLAGRTLLDVGCSNGWFLELASRAGCVCYGIEPDEFFFTRARQAVPPGVRLIHGYFPRDLPAEWAPFDIITFHDVFEHLPEPQAILRACRDRLAPGGHVVLSLPSADGFVFRLARGLARLGARGPLARMFQVNYPFPHLFYFTRRSVAAVAQRSGFVTMPARGLRSFSSRGALHRARLDRAHGPLRAMQAYAGAGALLLFAVLEPLLTPDNVLFVLRPTAE